MGETGRGGRACKREGKLGRKGQRQCEETHAESPLLNIVTRQEEGAEFLDLLLQTSYPLSLLIRLELSLRRSIRSSVVGDSSLELRFKHSDVRPVLVEERLVVDNLVLDSLEDNSLNSLGKLERRDGFGDGDGRRVHGGDDGDSRITGEGRLEDLSELRVAVGDVRPAKERG
jgi:hypothetical protein